MFFGRDNGNLHNGILLVASVFYTSFTYCLFTIIFDLTKVEDYDSQYYDVRKYLTSKTELEYFKFTRSPLGM
jgi:hypothetical protein